MGKKVTEKLESIPLDHDGTEIFDSIAGIRTRVSSVFFSLPLAFFSHQVSPTSTIARVESRRITRALLPLARIPQNSPSFPAPFASRYRPHHNVRRCIRARRRPRGD